MSKHLPYIKALEQITSRVRNTDSALKKDGKMIWTDEALTPARLAKHLEGTAGRGVCPIKAGESTTLTAVIDLDSHKGESTQGAMMKAARDIRDSLEIEGILVTPFRSSGGKGIHLYMLWNEPQDAYTVRTRLVRAIGDVGFKNGTAGVAKGEVEIFPKQDHVPEGGKGSQFILPLTGFSELLDIDAEIELGREAFIGYDMAISPPLPKLDRPVRAPARPPSGELNQWVGYLYAIDPDELSYEQWLEVVGFGLHYETGGSDEGFDLWDAWSSQSGKYTTSEYGRYKWDSIKNDKASNVTGQSIIHLARLHGYNADVLDAFDVIEAEDNTPVAVGDMKAAVGNAKKPLPNFKRNKNFEILGNINNVKKAVERPDCANMLIKFDQFNDQVMKATKPGQWEPFGDVDYTSLRLHLESQGFLPVGRELIRDVVEEVAMANQFDTAIEWLEKEVPAWDGVPRIDSFYIDYMNAEDTPYTRAVGAYTFTALAGRVLVPGCKADMVPILIGAQGVGKSTSVAALVPDVEFHREISFSRKEDDLARLLRGCLIAEIPELQGLRTKEIEYIKAFVTQTHEKWVPKFKEFSKIYPRRCLFIGTTNTDEFLDDESGHRRWLPLPVGQCDVPGIKAMRDQLWAEGRERFKADGVVAFADAQKLASVVHKNHTISDTWDTDIYHWLHDKELDGGAPIDQDFILMNDVLRFALNFNIGNTGRKEELRVAKILKKYGYVRATKRIEGEPTRVWARVLDLV